MTETEAAPLPEPEVPDAEELVLAGAFPAATRDQWQQLVLGVLRKSRRLGEDAGPADAEAALMTRLPDGFSVKALYTAEDAPTTDGLPGLPPYTRGASPVRGSWDIRPLHADADPAASQRAVMDDLEGGASSLWLRLGGGALPVAELARVLDGVYLDLAPVVLDAGAETPAAAAAFFALATAKAIPDAELLGTLGADPLGIAARTGSPADLTDAVELATLCAERYPHVRAVVVDALPFHEAGATDGQELGLALSAGVAYLRALTAAGLAVDAAAGELEFRYAATADQFATIAKLRAARRLWHRVTEASGVSAAARAQRQHAVTSPAMYAALDARTNLIRATIASFAAGVGGADAVTVLPFDAALGLPDGFSRRIARNTSSLLMEESHLAAVADPAGGSWAVESLTDSLARAAWKVFQEVERAGGLERALADGLVAERLAASAAQRVERLSSGAEGIVGVTDFPNLAEEPPSPTAPAGTADTAVTVPASGLPSTRAAAPFERLRRRSAEAAAERPQRVTLVTVGPARAAGKAVAAVEKLLAPGGVTAVVIDAEDELPPEVDGGVAVLCPAPDAEADTVQAARQRMSAAGATLVLDSGTVVKAGIVPVIEQVLDVLAPLRQKESA